MMSYLIQWTGYMKQVFFRGKFHLMQNTILKITTLTTSPFRILSQEIIYI